MSLLLNFSQALVTVSQRPRILGTRPNVPQESFVSIADFDACFCVDNFVNMYKARLWHTSVECVCFSFVFRLVFRRFSTVNHTLICPHIVINPLFFSIKCTYYRSLRLSASSHITQVSLHGIL